MAILDTVQTYVFTPTFPQFIFSALFSTLAFVAMLLSPHLTISYGLYELEYRFKDIDPSQRRSLLSRHTITFRPAWLALYIVIIAVQFTVWCWLLRECRKSIVVCWDVGNQSDTVLKYLEVGTTLTSVLILSTAVLVIGCVAVAITVSGIGVILGCSSKVNAGKEVGEGDEGNEEGKKNS